MSKTHILIIEDDDEIARLTAMYLQSENYSCTIIEHGSKAVDAIKIHKPDLVLLDLMLPGVAGHEICQQSRQFYFGPILILTACDDDITEVSLLKFGADDYLNKPIKPHILLARIEALLRRCQLNATSPEIHNKRLIIDFEKQQVFYVNELVDLTNAEFDTLSILAKNIGEIVSREACCKYLRGIEHDFSDRSIDMRISGLRKKLNDEKPPYQLIKTIRNKGYMLVNA